MLLLPGPEDEDIWRYFASASMPRQEQADAVIRALADAGRPLSTVALESIVDVRRTRLELLLKVLDVDGAVTRVPGGWMATGAEWAYDVERYARVTAAREREQDLMVEYERTQQCRMAFLQECLDDTTAEACGRCDRCSGPWFDATIPDAAINTARERLGRPGVVLEPRAQWPSGMERLGVPLKGKIAPAVAMSEGRAVARLSDLGWGQRLRELLRGDDRPVPDEVVRACIAVLAQWGWQERPVALVAIPSRRHPQIVTSLAARIGEAGRLPFLGSLDLVEGGPQGDPGGNSAFRLAGVWGRLAVGLDLAERLRGIPGPVLLVDDLADSRWTLTCAAALLREAGVPAVLPLTLALEA